MKENSPNQLTEKKERAREREIATTECRGDCRRSQRLILHTSAQETDAGNFCQRLNHVYASRADLMTFWIEMSLEDCMPPQHPVP